MEWITDTKTGYDDLEVYMEYGYVFVSSTGRNDVKMAVFSFKKIIKGNDYQPWGILVPYGYGIKTWVMRVPGDVSAPK